MIAGIAITENDVATRKKGKAMKRALKLIAIICAGLTVVIAQEQTSQKQLEALAKKKAETFLPVINNLFVMEKMPVEHREELRAKFLVIAALAYEQGFKDAASAASAASATSDRVIESRLDGDFEGHESGRLYKLHNGQIWEQVGAHICIRIRIIPAVTIICKGKGCRMMIDGCDNQVAVTRIK